MKSRKFNAESIRVLDAITAIRSRPQMYLGDISSRETVNILLQEILCVGLDKAEKGCATEVNIEISEEQIITVRDNGFPVGIADNRGEPLIKVLLTELFACRDLRPLTDFCKNGIAVSNAFSEFLQYDCGDGENHWQQKYEYGIPVNSLHKIADTNEVWEQFSFLLDRKIIKHPKVETKSFINWLQTKTHSIKNCDIFLNDKTAKLKIKIK